MERTGFRMKHSIPFVLLVIIIALAIPALGSLDPDTVFLTAVADAKVDASTPNANFGGLSHLVVGRVYEFLSEEYVFIKFDLSSVPAGSTVTGSSLRLYLYQGEAHVGGVNLMASRVTGGWTEGGITWNNKPGWDSSFATTSVGVTAGDYY